MMKRFATKFEALLVKLKIELELLKSYVDDVTEMLRAWTLVLGLTKKE